MIRSVASALQTSGLLEELHLDLHSTCDDVTQGLLQGTRFPKLARFRWTDYVGSKTVRECGRDFIKAHASTLEEACFPATGSPVVTLPALRVFGGTTDIESLNEMPSIEYVHELEVENFWGHIAPGISLPSAVVIRTMHISKGENTNHWPGCFSAPNLQWVHINRWERAPELNAEVGVYHRHGSCCWLTNRPL